MKIYSLTLNSARSTWKYTRRYLSDLSSQKTRSSSVTANDILFEDNHLIVLTKPPTVLTQGDETNDESLLDWTKSFIAEKYDKAGEAYLGLVHRIDRPCSGVIVFAKTSKAANRLSKAFSDRDVDKKYVCVVHGLVKQAGRCHNLLKLGGPDKNNKVTVRALPTQPSYGKISGEKLVEAKLGYKPLWTFQLPASASGERGVCTVLEIDLETGRKHQIRAQLSHIGHPICGDMKYNASAWSSLEQNAAGGITDGAAAAAPKGPVKRGRGGKGRARKVPDGEGGEFYNGKGIALHAFSLTVPHPITKERMTFSAPVPSAWESHFGSDILSRINAVIGDQNKTRPNSSVKFTAPIEK